MLNINYQTEIKTVQSFTCETTGSGEQSEINRISIVFQESVSIEEKGVGKQFNSNTFFRGFGNIKELHDHPFENDLARVYFSLFSNHQNFDESEIEQIRELFNQDKNLFFLERGGELLFELICGHSRINRTFPVLHDLIIDLPRISKNCMERMNNFLFDKSKSDYSIFEIMMRKFQKLDHAAFNRILDNLLAYLSDEELNSMHEWRDQIYQFAFSPERYSGITIQDDDIPEKLSKGIAETLRQSHAYEIMQVIDHKRDHGCPKYMQWLQERSAGSTTLNEFNRGQSASATKGYVQWVKAYEHIAQLAKQHKDKSEAHIQVKDIAGVHALMTQGSSDVPHPGMTRNEIYHLKEEQNNPLRGVVRIGGGSTRCLPCLPQKLPSNLNEFDIWINNEIKKCNQGVKNPILLAAQAYQRLVTLHPFENGNGRIARLLMDYILERYEVPAPILGGHKDVLDALFSLKPSPDRTAVAESLIDKIAKGIFESYSRMK